MKNPDREAPCIKKKPPLKEAKKWVKEDLQYVSQSYTRAYPLVVKKASGCSITDVDDNLYLDFTSGIAVCNTGHCHPKIVKAITDQAAKLIHMSGTDFYYPSQIKLAKLLAELSPGKESKKAFFCNSGAEAVEAAFKLARYKTKRPLILAFYGAFHGRTFGALSLSASKSLHRKNFQPLVPGVIHTPYAYCYRCKFNLSYPKCGIQCVDWIEEVIFKNEAPAEEVAAIIAEPIQGEGGYIVPPKEFHLKLYNLAKKYGILYIADEIQTGIGRTGRIFAMDHFGVTPDITSLAKGIASGMPLGAIVAKSSVMDWEPGSHASTFGGNPISCEAAIATISLVRDELCENAENMGNYAVKRLKKMQAAIEIIGDIRGKGLMIGIELVKTKKNKKKLIREREIIIQKCFNKGLLLLGCGQNSIRLMPPLTVNKKEIDKALDILEPELKAVCSRVV